MAKRKSSFSFTKYLLPILVAALVVTAGNFIFKDNPNCANSLTCKGDLSLKVENDAIGIFQGRTVIPPKVDLAIVEKSSVVLGDSTAPNKHIYIDLSNQTLYAYQGKTKVMQTLISSGKWGRTPTGNFNIWTKLRSTRMAGGSGADYYNLPNVPYVMYYYRDFGLHGAYWHNNFGHTMSHGCVNMRQIDAQALFDWAEVGTPVSVCDSFIAPGKCTQKDPVN